MVRSRLVPALNGRFVMNRIAHQLRRILAQPPSGKSPRMGKNHLSSPGAKNISLFQKSKSGVRNSLSRLHKRGASRSSRVLEAGCDGRGVCLRRKAQARTAKSCGPVPPTLGSSLPMRCRPDGRHAEIGRRRWLKGSEHRGEHEAAVNTNRAGNAVMFRRTCGDYSRDFYFHARLRVR